MSTEAAELYTAPTVSLDELTIFGAERAPVGRYKARLVASEVKQTRKGDDYVNAIWEIVDKGEWESSEFPIAYYTKATKNKKNPKKVNSRGIGDIILSFNAVGIKLSDQERLTFPTEANKIANLYARKFGRKVYDIVVYEESYTDDSGQEQKSRKARVAKPLLTFTEQPVSDAKFDAGTQNFLDGVDDYDVA